MWGLWCYEDFSEKEVLFDPHLFMNHYKLHEWYEF